jgi:hypothetical protein
MSEPYSEEHAEIAQRILERALDEMLAAGLGGVEAMHSAMHMVVDMLPAYCCKHHLAKEYEAIIAVIDERIEGIPAMTPGVDLAVCSEDLH